MIEINPSEWRTKPHPEQVRGVKHLVSKKYTALFDQPGVGKTKQVIDAACLLFREKAIGALVVFAPAAVRGVWDEPERGELAKHCWIPYKVVRYHSTGKNSVLVLPPDDPNVMLVVLVSYGHIRKEVNKSFPFAKELAKQIKKRKPYVVYDESSYVKSKTASQYKASRVVREVAEYCTIMNGTPVSNGIVDLWSQFNLLDPSMLYCERLGRNLNYSQFVAKYAIKGGYLCKEIVGYDEEEVAALRNYVRPWILRRRTEDCVGLPEKVYTHLEVTMPPASWKHYTEMRKALITYVGENASQAAHGAVKSVRLSQITSGFLGGIQVDQQGNLFEIENPQEIRELDDAKLQVFLDWYKHNQPEQLIVWCRFRPELLRVDAALKNLGVSCGLIMGGQTDARRQEVVNGFQDGTISVIVGQPRAGGIGLNLVQAHIEVYFSNDYNLITREQSENRVHRRGQTKQVVIYDLVSVGPKGQRTIDSIVLSALMSKRNLADFTADDWRRELVTE